MPYQTIGSDRIFVFNKSGEYFDKGMFKKINLLKNRIGGNITKVNIVKGEGDFLGSFLEDDLQARTEANSIFKDIIKNNGKI
jgi:hypothetical protein